jgi:hypothetical protein
MSAYWQPSVVNYLGRVSKDCILEAARQGVSEAAAENLSSSRTGLWPKPQRSGLRVRADFRKC